ncbi:toxin-antitoxin system HicB family antitoxin [bacterium]|nr:toxin-antitoxin system HicB family antitoxin [bacterium]
MSVVSLRIPDSLHNSVREIAKRDNTSINQFVISAVAEKISALQTGEYLRQRANKGSKKAFLDVLSKVPDVEPDECDTI